MKNHLLFTALLFITLASCKKSTDTLVEDACTGNQMFLLTKDGGRSLGKDSFAYDNQNRMTYAKFNSFGRITIPANANFTYDANNRIIKSVVKDNAQHGLLYTYGFTYTPDNKPDSAYNIGTTGRNYKFVYNTAGRLIKILEYSMPYKESEFYIDITTDDNDNITKVLSFYYGNDDDNISFNYDKRKNPLSGYALFFVGMDDIEDLLIYFGKNNYTDQTARINYSGAMLTVVNGEKYDYNNNCYPVKDQATLNGVAPAPGTDFIYIYK